MKLKIAVLFDGAGLARLGLEQAGHECTGYEIDPAKHHLSKMVGSGNCVLADVRDVDLRGFDAVWASPPCQEHSRARTDSAIGGDPLSDPSLLEWSLKLPHDILWVENVFHSKPYWGTKYNAAQFLQVPIQNRQRMIGGRYKSPAVHRVFKSAYHDLDICPSILATEYNAPKGNNGYASYWYGRRLSLRECAYHQGFEIPDGLLKSWFHVPDLMNPAKGKPYTWAQWRNAIYEAIGNGVPTYMSYAFGAAYTQDIRGWIQPKLLETA